MLMIEEHWVQLFTKQKKIIAYCTKFHLARTCQKRGKYTDGIKVLPLDILERVIDNACTRKKDDEGDDDNENKNFLDTGKELLHPITIAQMMPQIFWSLIYHYRQCLESDSNIQEYYLSVEHMLRQLLPNLDWSYLNHDGRQ
jgi:hypothetical protein